MEYIKETQTMGEFASNAKANTGVALGATGLGIAVANALSNGSLNLGGLFGNRQSEIAAGTAGLALNKLAEKDAEIAMLKSENYSDKVAKEVYSQTISDNKDLRTEMYNFINPIANEVANNRVEVAKLQEQLKCCCEKQELREQILTGKINEVALASNGRFNTLEAQITGNFNALNQTIACLSGKVNDITSTYVNACKVNPTPMPLANSFTTPPAGTTFYPGCISVGSPASSTPATGA